MTIPTDRSRGLSCILYAGLALAAPSPVPAQVELGIAVDQAYTSADQAGMTSPVGFRIVAGAHDVLGPLGLRFSHRRVTESQGELQAFCDFASCTEGPFDTSRTLTTTSLGVTVQAPVASVAVTLGTDVSFSSQNQRLEPADVAQSAETVVRGRVGPDLGFGVFSELHGPAVLLGARPLLYVRYDRITASECVPDGSCLGGRNVGSVGLGISWLLD